MKKIIDNESGRIISILNVDEAKKILEMYINYCLGKRDVTQGRLNLVGYLGDFIKYADKKDITKFYDVLAKSKDSFEFSKTDLKAYESLMAFFEMYNNIDKGEFDVAAISTYINSATTKKQEIDTKLANNEELNFEEKLNNIFFNKDFDVTILAKSACEKWEEQLKEKIKQNNGELDVSLKEEIAYQDLLDLCNGVATPTPKAKETSENKEPVKEEKNEEVEEVQGPIINFESSETPKEESKTEEKDEVKEEEKKEETEEEVQGPIINFVSSDTSKEDKKDEKAEEPADEKKEEKNDSKPSFEEDLIIGSSSIREATQDVSLRDAAGMFNSAIDSTVNDKEKENNSNSSDSTSERTLRDQ